MNHGSLFSGIGGFDLAAQWMGWRNIFHCELNPFGRRVLNHYWPESISYENIIESDFSVHRGNIGILSGGFPCQDASKAKATGGQTGLQGERTGLWWEMLRAIREVRPKYVVAENVANLLHTNGGADFRIILEGLWRLGYNAEWRVCRASEVGGCHHRARVYLVAYPSSVRLQAGQSFFTHVLQEVSQERRFATGTATSVGVSWADQPAVSGLDDGLSTELDGITFPKWRNESIKAYGNAIVPQVALQIFRAIQQYELDQL